MSAPEAERFPLKDRDGYPLGVSCFVDVEVARLGGSGRTVTFQGVVREIEQDSKGPILHVREWSRGGWTGKDRLARPGYARVRQAPPAARELLTDEARFSRVVADRGAGVNPKKRKV